MASEFDQMFKDAETRAVNLGIALMPGSIIPKLSQSELIEVKRALADVWKIGVNYALAAGEDDAA